jgi:FkbM family methyltransferase
MSKLSSFVRKLRQRPSNDSILVTGEPPFRMATLASDRIIGKTIREKGAWEENTILKVKAFLKNDNEQRIFFDIGANIGTHSIFALQNGYTRAVCVEPDKTNFMLLRVNQIFNGLEDRCVNINAAVSSEISHVELALSTSNPGDHRIKLNLSESASSDQIAARHVVSVPTITLDSLLTTHHISPAEIALVWMDIQGYEGQALQAASTLVEANVAIVMEFWPFGLKANNGYELLRPILSTLKIRDVNELPKVNRPLSMADIDALYKKWADNENMHSDFLLMRN